MSRAVRFYLLSKRVLARFKGVMFCGRCSGALAVGDEVVSRKIHLKNSDDRIMFYHSSCWEGLFV